MRLYEYRYIRDTAATGNHFPNQPVCIGMAALIVKVMVANKLPATVLAEVFLLVVAGFAVSLYILSSATGTVNSDLCLHNPNILCFRRIFFVCLTSVYVSGHC